MWKLHCNKCRYEWYTRSEDPVCPNCGTPWKERTIVKESSIWGDKLRELGPDEYIESSIYGDKIKKYR